MNGRGLRGDVNEVLLSLSVMIVKITVSMMLKCVQSTFDSGSVSTRHFALLPAAAVRHAPAAAALMRPAPASPHRRPASTASTPSPPRTVSPPGVIHRRERAGRWIVPGHRPASSHAGARSAVAPDGWGGTAPLRWSVRVGVHVRRFASHRRRTRG